MEYKLVAKLGVFSKLNGGDKSAKNSDKEKPMYKPLVNKRLIVVSQPPSKINFNINVAKNHEASSLFIK